MNFFQTKRKQQLQTLNSGLVEFGLSPVDWILSQDKQDQIKIQHKEEPEFCFIGKTKSKNGKAIWKSIQLVSL